MPSRFVGHDRAPAAPDQDAVSLLSAALGRLRLTGAIFLRGEYTEPWAYESLRSGDLATILVPGAERVILFHVIANGRCWIETTVSDRRWAEAGDVIVLPYGDSHRMGGSEHAVAVSVATLVDLPPWEQMPFIRHGEGGASTNVICGYLTCDDPLFDPRLRALPPVFVVTPPSGAAKEWVRASIDYAMQQTERVSPDRFEVPARVPELLLIEVLKLHLAGTPTARQGWLKALRDPVLAPALAAIHATPERKWSVADLAKEATVSTSVLDERFREVLGLPPIRYLTGWRMHVAEELLHAGEMSVGRVARSVGYQSEEAFSRAFKRARGRAPSNRLA
jgi:AraC-like DNA-binding protein